MPKRRKGFKTSPSIRIPRVAAEKMQAAAAAAADKALKSMGELHAKTHARMTQENDVLRNALKDAVALVDELLVYGGKKDGWTREDAIRLEHIRALSVF